jgi:formate/nitrite transporter FocA (FNT family)
MITKIFAGIFLALTLLFLLLAQAGDNPDAKALATLFYLPAFICGLIDAALFWIIFR